jgi:hypothetical protein
MQNLHYSLIMLLMLMNPVTSANAQVSIGIGLPNVSIGINLPVYPELTRVPGYPVYYAAGMDANYFFYDSMYWVYRDDNWYASSWYNGPWGYVAPNSVPLYILRVPVRYYRQPPEYFRGWQTNAPPRWGQHWGRSWEQQRSGWDKWKRSSAPAPAPLPVYQRKFSGDNYPRAEQQNALRSESYRYQPRDTAVRKHLNQLNERPAQAPARGQEQPATRNPQHQERPQAAPLQQGAPAGPHTQPPQRGGEQVQRSAPERTPPPQQATPPQEQRNQPGASQRQQQAPRQPGQEQRSQEPNQGRGQGQGQRDDNDRGRGRDR